MESQNKSVAGEMLRCNLIMKSTDWRTSIGMKFGEPKDVRARLHTDFSASMRKHSIETLELLLIFVGCHSFVASLI